MKKLKNKSAPWLKTLKHEIQKRPSLGKTFVIAVSGGGDSIALLYGLARLVKPLELTLVVAHLDHGWRAESAQDAAFVREVALELGLFCVCEQQDVGAAKGNFEATARQRRYAFFERVAQAVGAGAVLLAHTADDQAETLLMNLLRGAGLDGLKGMTTIAPSPIPDAKVPLFRPLLLVARETLRAWLREEGYAWREDATNADTRYFRNRMRHEIIPYLEQERPHLRPRLARTAQLLAGEQAWLSELTEQAWQKLVTREKESIQFARPSFLTQPLALQRRLIRRAFFDLSPTGRELSYEQTEEALRIATQGESGSQATLPGHLCLKVKYDQLWIGPVVEKPVTPSRSLTLPNVGTFHAEKMTIILTKVGRDAIPQNWRTFPPHTALLDADALIFPLTLRHPKPHERWAPLGMNGKLVHLRDWMAKRKVPLEERDHAWLLVDAQARILWVVGWQVGHVARLRETSTALIRVEHGAREHGSTGAREHGVKTLG